MSTEQLVREKKPRFILPDFDSEDYKARVRIEGAMNRGIRKFLYKEGFQEINVPHITHATGACENIDTLFEVSSNSDPHWFDTETKKDTRAYLSQTGQLYLEVQLRSFLKVCCIGPSFRAEQKIDTRHATEFPLAEIEFRSGGPYLGLLALMRYEEDAVRSIAREVLECCSYELNKINGNTQILKALVDSKDTFPRIMYSQAIEDLGLPWGSDLKHGHEIELVNKYTQGLTPMFIILYPEEMKFFNMSKNRKYSQELKRSVVNSVDMIVPFGGEAAGGAERIYDVEELERKLKQSTMIRQLEAKGGSIDDFEWYIEDMRQNGSKPHAGCGFGMNRIAQYIMAEPDITKVCAYPQNRQRLT